MSINGSRDEDPHGWLADAAFAHRDSAARGQAHSKQQPG